MITVSFVHRKNLPAGPSINPVGKALPSNVVVRPRSPFSPFSPFLFIYHFEQQQQ